MYRSRCNLFLEFCMIIFIAVFVLVKSPLLVHAAASEPTWAFPFLAGTSVSISPKGLHGDNFRSISDDRTGKGYRFTNPTDATSLDLVLEPEHLGTSSIATTPLARGTVLAVWAKCHVVLLDYGNGWWSIYLHLTNITVSRGDTVTVSTKIGYPTTNVNTACGESSSAEHTHVTFLSGSGTTGTYISMLGRKFCEHQVIEQNKDLSNIILQGLTTKKGQVFTVPTCSPSTNNTDARGVAAISTNDAWIVGSTGSAENSYQALIEHWNGTTWDIVSSPNIQSGADLNSVAAVSKNDVWAVGAYSLSNHSNQSLIEHWNGTTWSIVSSPFNYSNLYGVTALSSNNVWAVGCYDSGSNKGLVEHWNGTIWRVVSTPTLDACLVSVAAVSSNNVWAVGFAFIGHIAVSVIEHWNGIGWSIVSSPKLNGSDSGLASVAAVSSNNVWAVGSNANQTLIEHWDGTNWSIVSNPSNSGFLTGVAVLSSNNVWVVGSDSYSSLIEHWDGTNWSIVSNPAYAIGASLTGIVALSSNVIWAIGTYIPNSIYQTVIEHWDGTSWNIVSNPATKTS